MLGKFKNTKIAKKITILYGGIFSLTIIVISVIIMGNAVLVRESSVRQEVIQSVDNIQKAIESGSEITDEALEGLLQNKYVEFMIVNMKTGDYYKSAIGGLPPFVIQPEMVKNMIRHQDSAKDGGIEGRTQLPPEEEGFPGFSGADEKSIKNEKKSPRNDGREYMIQGDGGNEFMLVERTVSYGENIYFVQAFKMITEQRYYVYGFALRLLILDAVGILIAFLIGKYISRLILKPVENIRQTAERISIEDLSQRIELSGPDDEMKELSITFNSMIERLEESFQRQTQFISDASHELRTPISVIQGYANLVNRWGKSDPTILQESIDSILAETEHMSTLIKKLLFLAKSDQNKNHLQKQEITLNQMAQDIARELRVMETGRLVKLEEKDEVKVYADPDLLKQLLWIYTENSLKYTSQETGEILFCVWKDKQYGYISVSDNGAGMEAEDLPHIFDRFYRADKSRNKEIPGTGLGLSIAKWIMDSHHGEIIVNSTLGEGTSFTSKFHLFKE